MCRRNNKLFSISYTHSCMCKFIIQNYEWKWSVEKIISQWISKYERFDTTRWTIANFVANNSTLILDTFQTNKQAGWSLADDESLEDVFRGKNRLALQCSLKGNWTSTTWTWPLEAIWPSLRCAEEAEEYYLGEECIPWSCLGKLFGKIRGRP